MPAQDEYTVEILKDVGLVSLEDIQKANERAKADGVGVVDALILNGRISHMDVSKALASQFGMDTINLADYRVPDDVLALVPKHVARRYKVIPVYKHDNTLTVAISDPLDVDTVDSLRYILRMNVEPVVAAKNDIENSITRYYGGADDTVENMLQEITEGEIDLGLASDRATDTKIEEGVETDTDAPIIKLVGLVIMEATATARAIFTSSP
jgi:general secretion pathway protein E/type IV pilus assembly protein PilB